jgi:hypothetical protein
MCALSEKESGGWKTRFSWSTESMLVEVDTRPSCVCLEVDFQVFLCVPVYHKTLPIANFRLPILVAQLEST